MFLTGAMRGTQLEYGMRASPWWIPLLLLLLFAVPVTMYLSALFSSWEELMSFLAIRAAHVGNKIMAALHWHPHSKLHVKGHA